MEPTGDLDESILRWLERSGRGLELRVARMFLQNGSTAVDQSFEYTDVQLDKLREGDVRAKFAWTGREETPCSITAVVECKSTTDKPWVAMHDRPPRRTKGDLQAWATFAHGPFLGITDRLSAVWMHQPPFVAHGVATHVVTALGKEVGNNPDPAADAVRQATSAASAEVHDYISNQLADRRGIVVVPVVVTNAPLRVCYLDGEGKVRLEPTSSIVVKAPVTVNSHGRAYIINEPEVPRFARSLADLAELANLEAREADRS